MDIKEAMAQALELERKGREYYTEIANSTDNKFVKDVFTYVADQEVFHEKEIKGYIDSSNINIEDDTKAEVKTFFGQEIEKFKENMKASTKHTEAYEKAMQLEHDAYNFYKAQHEKADTQELKDFLEFLMRQESGHYSLFKNAMEYLKDPESYHMEQEDWNFEG
jgi:rubrerythrin